MCHADHRPPTDSRSLCSCHILAVCRAVRPPTTNCFLFCGVCVIHSRRARVNLFECLPSGGRVLDRLPGVIPFSVHRFVLTKFVPIRIQPLGQHQLTRHSPMASRTELPYGEEQQQQNGQSGQPPPVTVLDVHRGKSVRLQVKVVVPTADHPNYNFVGKLLGPKGNSLKWLQERTQTKMAILGRGSMRNKEKEDELRERCDPKYGHLNEDLHVEITAYAPAPEAYQRISNALFEIKRFLVPDYYDEIRKQQLRELGVISADGAESNSSSFPLFSQSEACPATSPVGGPVPRPAAAAVSDTRLSPYSWDSMDTINPVSVPFWPQTEPIVATNGGANANRGSQSQVPFKAINKSAVGIHGNKPYARPVRNS